MGYENSQLLDERRQGFQRWRPLQFTHPVGLLLLPSAFRIPLPSGNFFHLLSSQKVIKKLSSSNTGLKDIVLFSPAPKWTIILEFVPSLGRKDELSRPFSKQSRFYINLTPAICCISREILNRKVALQGAETWLNIYENSLDNIQKIASEGLSKYN